MKKALMLALVLLVIGVWAVPATYQVKKLPSAASITVDGNIGEWLEGTGGYFIDSLHSDTNCYFRYSSAAKDTGHSWTRNIFQAKVYSAYDDNKVYFAVQVVAESLYVLGGNEGSYTGGASKLSICEGGMNTGFFLHVNGTFYRNPACAFQKNTSVWVGANSTGNGAGLATYEFALKRNVLDMFDAGNFQLSVGTETPSNYYMGVGSAYTGKKDDFDNNPWQTMAYFPTYELSATVGPNPVGVENRTLGNVKVECVSANPNPFMPSTVLSYTAKNNGSLKIYDVNGKTVRSFETKAGANKVAWDGKDMTGKSVSSGIYIARLKSGNNIHDTRLFLTR